MYKLNTLFHMKEGVFIRKDFSSESSYTRVLYERPKYARIHTAPKASQSCAFMHKAEHTAQ